MKKNFKAVIVCLLAILCLGFLTEEAYALSVQVRGGGIVAPVGGGGGTTTITQEGIDVFIYEGKTVDIFVGGLIVNPFTEDRSGDTNDPIKSDTIGANFYGAGLRYRFITGGWGKPYLSLGIFNGTVNEENQLQANWTLTSGSTKHSSSYLSTKIGIGTDIPIAERFSMGIELDAYIMSAPTEKYGTAKNNTNNNTSDMTSNPPPVMPGFTIGIRYHF